MKTIIRPLISLLLLCTVITLNAQKQVAVYITGDQEPEIKKVLGSKMVTYITQSDEYNAIERTADFLRALQDEKDYQTSGEVSNSQIVKLGQQFGARYVAVVDVSELFGELFISARLINVQTNLVEQSYEESGKANSMSALTNLANNIADGLIFKPERIKKQKEQADLDRQKQQKENQLAELRQRAIANLTPPNSVLVNGYIYAGPFSIECYVNTNNDVVWKANIPRGFEIADAVQIEELVRQNCSILNEGYYAFRGGKPVPGYPFNKKKKKVIGICQLYVFPILIY